MHPLRSLDLVWVPQSMPQPSVQHPQLLGLCQEPKLLPSTYRPFTCHIQHLYPLYPAYPLPGSSQVNSFGPSFHTPSLIPRYVPKLQAWARTHILPSSPVSCVHLISHTFCILSQPALSISDTTLMNEIHMSRSHHKTTSNRKLQDISSHQNLSVIGKCLMMRIT